MRKTGKPSDYRRRKNLIRSLPAGPSENGPKIAPQKWVTALIVCPMALIENVSASQLSAPV